MSPWLAAAYAVLALGLAWSLTGGARWLRRIPFIVGAPVLAVALWLGRPDPAGWPSSGRLPAHADLVSAVVREPDPATSDRGRIFVWLDVGESSPRAFALPYSRALHEQVQRALGRIARRQPVSLVTARPGAGAGAGHGLDRVDPVHAPQRVRASGQEAVSKSPTTARPRCRPIPRARRRAPSASAPTGGRRGPRPRTSARRTRASAAPRAPRAPASRRGRTPRRRRRHGTLTSCVTTPPLGGATWAPRTSATTNAPSSPARICARWSSPMRTRSPKPKAASSKATAARTSG